MRRPHPKSTAAILREEPTIPNLNPTPTPRPPEHRCSRCYGPYGKSAIPCPNEPKGTK